MCAKISFILETFAEVKALKKAGLIEVLPLIGFGLPKLGFWSAVEQKSFKKPTILSFCLGLLRLIWLAAALDLVLSQNQNIQPYGYFHRTFASIICPISNSRVEKPEKLIELNCHNPTPIQPNLTQHEVGVTRLLVCNPPPHPPTTPHKLLDHFQTT